MGIVFATFLSSNLSFGQKDNNLIESANVLEFGPDNVLFIGDSKKGSIHAFSTDSVNNPNYQYGYNIKDLNGTIAKHLKVESNQFLVKDMAVHPATKEAYLAVEKNNGKSYMPYILVINQGGDISTLDLSKAEHSEVKIKNAPADEFMFWDQYESGDLTFTDIDFHKGKLYISGLSNTDFSSSLRIVNYPFDGNSQSLVNVEIYHANHNQNETRAPIRTLEIVSLSGEDYLLAAYTCTPLVTIPLSSLKDGAKVKGKTIAELGYGNTPIDLFQFAASDMEGNQYDVVFLSNKNQMAQVISLDAIEADNQKDGLSEFQNFQRGGTSAFDVPVVSALHVDEQDGYHLLTIRRNIDNGNLELVSVMKNLYFRLSDFQSEFEFPDYQYPDGSEFFQNVQNQMRQDEGFQPKK